VRLHLYCHKLYSIISIEVLSAIKLGILIGLTPLTRRPDQLRFTIIGSDSCRSAMQPSTARANKQLGPRQQLANAPPPQSATPGLHPVSIHQMARPEQTFKNTHQSSLDQSLTILSPLGNVMKIREPVGLYKCQP